MIIFFVSENFKFFKLLIKQNIKVFSFLRNCSITVLLALVRGTLCLCVFYFLINYSCLSPHHDSVLKLPFDSIKIDQAIFCRKHNPGHMTKVKRIHFNSNEDCSFSMCFTLFIKSISIQCIEKRNKKN